MSNKLKRFLRENIFSNIKVPFNVTFNDLSGYISFHEKLASSWCFLVSFDLKQIR